MDDKNAVDGNSLPSSRPRPSLPSCAITSPLCFPRALALHVSLSTDVYKTPPAAPLRAAKPADAGDVNLRQETGESEAEGKGEAAQQRDRDKKREKFRLKTHMGHEMIRQ